jgi:hypothetical protein
MKGITIAPLDSQRIIKEKIFTVYISHKGLITRTCRELKNILAPQINDPMKWEIEMNRVFSQEEVQMAKKCMKKYSPSLGIKEMQIKTTLRFHLTSC